MPHSLAGVVTALLSEECISRPNVYAAYRPSAAAAAVLEALVPVADRLDDFQQREAFAAPLCLSPQFVGLVESWAAGSDWCVRAAASAHRKVFSLRRSRAHTPPPLVRRAQVCSDTSLDEGDVARLLRRVAEFLGQVSDIPHTSTELRATAKAARRLVDRPPISDLVS